MLLTKLLQTGSTQFVLFSFLNKNLHDYLSVLTDCLILHLYCYGFFGRYLIKFMNSLKLSHILLYS